MFWPLDQKYLFLVCIYAIEMRTKGLVRTLLKGSRTKGGPSTNRKSQNLQTRPPNPETKKTFFLDKPVRRWVRGGSPLKIYPTIEIINKQ